jgi:hypothetical protein
MWPLARAAGAIGRWDDFPPVEELARVFDPTGGEIPVRFVHAAPRRRRGAPVDPRMLYDARIALEAQVPTRGRCWHDLMNALVWGTFPRSKRALHVRQHRAIAQRLAPDAHRLPPTRSRELDALALVDEGGVVLLASDPTRLRALREQRGPTVWRSELASGAVDAVVFGHAIYESLVLGVKPAVVAAVVVGRPPGEVDLVRAADRGLAHVIEDSALLRSPEELGRVDLPVHPIEKRFTPEAERDPREPPRS